jgi:hypothetical protein
MTYNQKRQLRTDLLRLTASFAAGIAFLYAIEGKVEYQYILPIAALILISLVLREFHQRQLLLSIRFSHLTLRASVLIILGIFGSLALLLAGLCFFTR